MMYGVRWLMDDNDDRDDDYYDDAAADDEAGCEDEADEVDYDAGN